MSEPIIQWHDVKFYANAKEVRGFSNLTVSGSVETEDQENGGSKYVSKKNSKGFEIAITAYFDKRLGISDVKKEAMKLVNYAANGQTGYIYSQNKKLVTSVMMLTSAKAQKIIMTPGGTWISCEVSMTLKMSSKLSGLDSPSGGNSGGGYKYSVTVYYSGSSGAVSSVTGYSNISKDDARKKAWAKVPKTAHWASETKSQASNQTQGRVNTAARQQAAAKKTSQQIGILARKAQVTIKKVAGAVSRIFKNLTKKK